MSGGITRKNGTLIAPKNFSGVALKDFTITFGGGDTNAQLVADLATPGGALDQIFRTATGNVGSVSRVGSLGSGTTLRFALEVLGDDELSAGKLGMGLPTNAASIAAALQAAIVAVGDVVTPGTATTIHLSAATVTAFVY